MKSILETLACIAVWLTGVYQELGLVLQTPGYTASGGGFRGCAGLRVREGTPLSFPKIVPGALPYLSASKEETQEA